MEEKYFNLGVKSFGLELVIKKIECFYSQYKLPLISVGSGLGALECLVKEKHTEISLICVDPEPSSWHARDKREPFFAPQYPLVKDLIKDHPSLVGNCVLLLNWCCPNESEYDSEAMRLLRPVSVLTLVEFFRGGNGAAGGESFFEAYLLGESNYETVQVATLDEHDQTISHMDN